MRDGICIYLFVLEKKDMILQNAHPTQLKYVIDFLQRNDFLLQGVSTMISCQQKLFTP